MIIRRPWPRYCAGFARPSRGNATWRATESSSAAPRSDQRDMRIGISALFFASGGSLSNLAQLLKVWTEDDTLDRHDIVLFASRGTHAGLELQAGADVLRRIKVRVMEQADRGLLRRLIAE